MLRALGELWRQVDEEAASRGLECLACGRCCDFSRAGHILFGAKIELDACLAWAREALGVSRSTVAARLGEGRCPFQDGRTCAARAVRMVGCRTYFCSGTSADASSALGRDARRRLASLSESHGVAWWYGPALAYFERNLGPFGSEA